MFRHPIFQSLCLAAILLAWAVPAGAQNGLIRDSKTGCATSNPFPRENETITWTGGCENGLLSGYGVLTWQEGDTPYERDEGVFKNGELDGLAVIAFADGSRVYGRYRGGKRNGDFIIDRGEGTLVLARYEAGQFVTERAMSEAETDDWRKRGEAAFIAIMRDSGAGPVQVVGNRDAPTRPEAPAPQARPAVAVPKATAPAAVRAPEPTEPDPDFGDKTYRLQLADTDVAAAAAVVFGNLLRLPYTVESGGDTRIDLVPAQAVTGNQLLVALRDALARQGLQAVRRKGRYLIAPAPAGTPLPVRTAVTVAPTDRTAAPAPVPAPPAQVAARVPAAPVLVPPALTPPPVAATRRPVALPRVTAPPVAAAPVAALPPRPWISQRPAASLPPPFLRRAAPRPAAGTSHVGAIGIPRSIMTRPGRPRVGGMACLRTDILGHGRRWCGFVQAMGPAGVAVRLTMIDLTGGNLPIYGPAVCTGGTVLSRFAAGRVIQVPADCLTGV